MSVGLLSSISDAISDGSDDDDVFTYQCASCGSEFDLPKTRMIGVRCPDCRSMDVRDASES
ncbi:hypothetical protein B4589_014605 [Halolamina sp. CBA1230]|uniref:hypothetical protein n=1 Tax=Halolamina sp. CBA1230 TaxID=1853690 RepID=UPI0009A254ED|nr:hypothetical protein [Halolamina sp. CBA1230]QKY18827.1 hypothetical protein B4589_014605 [Halolamina sp. CBA1230]